MTTAQKVIKYFALALAAAIIFGIITASITIMRGVYIIASGQNKTLGDMHSMNVEDKLTPRLDINVSYTNLIIKRGEQLKAETNDTNVICSQDNQTLKISEKDQKHYFSHNHEETIIVYIPENMTFDNVDIDVGAGKVEIEKLNSKVINFDFGAGKSKIENLNISERANIKTGAGKVEITSGDINNLDLDMGAGSVDVTSNILGNSKINAGVGSLNININGLKKDYKIKATKGLGNIRIDGNNISNETTFGDGNNNIDLNGGVGSINVKFQ